MIAWQTPHLAGDGVDTGDHEIAYEEDEDDDGKPPQCLQLLICS